MTRKTFPAPSALTSKHVPPIPPPLVLPRASTMCPNLKMVSECDKARDPFKAGVESQGERDMRMHVCDAQAVSRDPRSISHPLY